MVTVTLFRPESLDQFERPQLQESELQLIIPKSGGQALIRECIRCNYDLDIISKRTELQMQFTGTETERGIHVEVELSKWRRRMLLEVVRDKLLDVPETEGLDIDSFDSTLCARRYDH